MAHYGSSQHPYHVIQFLKQISHLSLYIHPIRSLSLENPTILIEQLPCLLLFQYVYLLETWLNLISEFFFLLNCPASYFHAYFFSL